MCAPTPSSLTFLIRCALLNGSLGFVPVVLDVRLGRFNAMVSCVVQVTLCTMGVMRGGFVTPRFVVFGRFPVVPCRVFVMFRRLAVMLCRLFGHIFSPVATVKRLLLGTKLTLRCYGPMTKRQTFFRSSS